MQPQAKMFNSQIFLEFMCYSAFAGVMFYLVSSGKYLLYVTPRMEPYLYFTAIVMGIWALAGLGRLFRPQYKIRSMHCFVLVIPVLLLLLPHSPLSISDLSGNYIGGNTLSLYPSQRSPQTSQAEPSPDDSGLNPSAGIPVQDSVQDSIEGNKDIANDSFDSAPWKSSAYLSGLDTANKKITVSNDDFGMWINEIYMDMKKYEGYTIIMTGFVYKDPELLNENEFIPVRLAMTCCVADLAPVGLLCKYDRVSDLKADSWVTVEGTLFIGQYDYYGEKYDEPQIKVTKISPAEEAEGYVYLY